MTIPASIVHRDTPTWLDDSFTDSVTGVVYTSATHTLQYVMAGPIATPVTLTSTASGTGWTTTLDSPNSILMVAGLYWWQAILTAAGFRKVAFSGELTVGVNLAYAPANYDARGDYQIALDLWRAALKAVTSTPVLEYQIGNRRLTYRNTKEIIDMIDWLSVRAVQDKTGADGGKSRHLLVRFQNAT